MLKKTNTTQRFTLFQTEPNTYEGFVAVDPLDTIGLKTYALYASAWAKQPLGELKLSVVSANYPKQNLTVSKKLGGLEPEAGEMTAIEAFKNTVSPIRYWDALPFRLPVTQCMNSPFGVKRFYNGIFSGNYHKGLDQKSPAGTPIKAIAGGIVKIAKPYQLHGGTVAVDHGQGIGSIYIHMSKIGVKPNQPVQAGDTLGLVGSTGFAMGPHLHWGLYVFGIPVNPQAGFVSVGACG